MSDARPSAIRSLWLDIIRPYWRWLVFPVVAVFLLLAVVLAVLNFSTLAPFIYATN